MREHVESDEVWVYQYLYWDADTDAERASKVYATMDMIRLGLGCPLSASAMKISAHELVDGIYLPPNVTAKRQEKIAAKDQEHHSA